MSAPRCADRELRLSSKTGSGKTVALGLVLAQNLFGRDERPQPDKGGPRGLVIAPTRELAMQIAGELEWLFADLGIRLATLTGGIDIRRDFRALGSHPAIVVGTPGRLVDHLQRGSLELGRVESVILDEADEMLDMGFRDELEGLLDATPPQRRTHMVSATFPRKVLFLADRYQDDPMLVEGTPVGAANTDIAHSAYVVDGRQRPAALINLLLAQGDARTLVFARTRADTSALSGTLAERGFSAAPLNGDMGQRERSATLAAFRAGTIEVLVATDVAARGLDVDDIDTVIHYDLPESDEVFTHRSGRTGRAGKAGRSVLLLTPRQQHRIARTLEHLGIDASWPAIPQPADVREAAESRLVGELADLEPARLDHQELASKLLEVSDPLPLVQALIARIGHLGPCDPEPLQAPKASKPRPSHDRKARGSGRSHDRHFTPFFVNWGSRAGANPSRLLAMVCRRGNLSSSQVGAIRIAPHSALVEVVSDRAASFEKVASRPDSRNPKVKIRPWREPGAHAQSRRARGPSSRARAARPDG